MPKSVILCVDDELSVLTSLRQELEAGLGHDFLIECAESAEEALEAYDELVAQGQQVQVVLSDQIMPGMKGDQLLVKLYERDANLKTILLTGQATADSVGNAINRANLFRYIGKPWNERDLRMTVQEAARTYREQSALDRQVAILDSLNRGTQYLADTLNPEVLAERLLTSALLDTHTNIGVLWLRQPDGQHRFYTNESDGDPDTVDPVHEIRPADAATQFPVGWMDEVFGDGQPRLLADAAYEGPLVTDKRVATRKIRSICAVPIAVSGEAPLGVLYLEEQAKAHHFRPDTLEFLSLFTGYAAVCFQNTWLYHNLEATVQSRTELLQERNQSMRRSIAFAHRIQTSVLPPLEELLRHFPKAFVYYQPKDVVSGDFYWMGHHQGYFYVAAVDCTGHGVPGALVSVLGSNLFTQAVYEQNLKTPGEVLNWVNRHVRQTFKQYGENAEVQDGMDLAMVAIADDRSHLYFGGAKRPLWHLRDGELRETKGDRFPIGGSNYDLGADDEVFTTQHLQLQPGDRLFLFTDGLTDQFGGDDGGKKFSTRAFRELLLGAQDLPLPQQRDVIRRGMAAWQGEQPQTDDRCLIGLEIPAH
ncbi:MAG: SpoIIE family protein phosphatase [Bacteroidia bacterium]|nr:SpoIIE family protein phosphatase [Bacteroidia bacterium]